MPLFRYQVTDKSGKVLNGVMNAASEQDVRQSLVSKGYVVNTVLSTGSGGQQRRVSQLAGAAPRGKTSRTSAPPSEMMVFFRSMASFLHAGMTVFDSLSRIANQTPNRGMRIIATRMAARVQAGERLSEAMQEFPRVFPQHVVGVMSAGELGGFLPIVIGDVAFDYELAERASSKWLRWIGRLLWIHAIVLLILAPLIPLMFTPGVESFQEGLQVGFKFISTYVVPPLGLMVIGYHAAGMLLRRPSMRRVKHAMILRLPGKFRLASIMRSMANFTRILGHLQQAGVPLMQSWDAASRAAENSIVSERLHAQIDGIRSGMKLSDAVAATGYLDSEYTRVLAAGEVSGQTADALKRIAAHYEDAAQGAVGQARWFGFRTGCLASIVAGGATLIGFALTYPRLLTWVLAYLGLD